MKGDFLFGFQKNLSTEAHEAYHKINKVDPLLVNQAMLISNCKITDDAEEVPLGAYESRCA